MGQLYFISISCYICVNKNHVPFYVLFLMHYD